MLLVTNSHQHTLDIKAEVTGIVDYFDGVHTSHSLGAAKEDQPFWEALKDRESFDPARTVFIDDNVAVLQSARDFGVEMLLHITRPDTRLEPSSHDDFVGMLNRAQTVSDHNPSHAEPLEPFINFCFGNRIQRTRGLIQE